jgi:hypothetical protein
MIEDPSKTRYNSWGLGVSCCNLIAPPAGDRNDLDADVASMESPRKAILDVVVPIFGSGTPEAWSPKIDRVIRSFRTVLRLGLHVGASARAQGRFYITLGAVSHQKISCALPSLARDHHEMHACDASGIHSILVTAWGSQTFFSDGCEMSC